MMHEMKHSGIDWIGKTPANWIKGKLKHAYETYTGDSIKDEEKDLYTSPDNAIPYISTKDIDVETKHINYENGLYIPATNHKFKIAPKDSFLLCVEGGSAGKKIAYTTTDVCFVNKLCCFRAKQQSNSKFMYFYCQCDAFLVDFDLNTTGLIGGVSQNTIKNIHILMPTEAEQKIIADHLDKECARIDSLVEKQRSIIEKLKEYKKSVITEAVTCGLNPAATMKDSGIEWIGKIPAHWEIKRTKYVSQYLEKGSGITKEDVILDGDIQCIRYGEIYSKYDKQVIECLSATNLDKINSPKHLSKGDILFAGTGELIEEIGKNIVYMGEKPCLAGGDIIILKHSQNPVFLNYALGSYYAQSQKSFGKIKLKVVHISAEAIGNILIALPPIEEQQAIADYLDKKCGAIDRVIEKREQMIELLNEYKKSLIYECVTGKKEVA